ncbi:LolA family protein [Rathayibacter soli]|uniref:LolA family protein n=1 Tax=Rathayibacter soli TaxID=3144168 RepID=UPI0027E44E03|nr:DUF2092 domain-containing protein [Glaciibacter superstes]
MSRVLLRWLPAVVVPVLIAGGTLAANAVADVTLPAKTPEQVVALIAGNSVNAFSGTVQQSSDLGLPELPTTGPAAGAAGSMGASSTDAAAASALELLTGSHTLRVYADGPTKERVQVMDTLAERDLVRSGSDLWLYDSQKATATHVTLPSASAPQPDATMQTPAQLAQKLLANLTPSTAVTLGANTNVAGHDAYDLVLTPRTSGTLVGSVSIAVDAQNGFPLSVAVTARGAQALAFSVAFSDLNYQAPSADLFSFSPPAGTTVKQHVLPTKSQPQKSAPSPGTTEKRVVTGSDWSTVVQVPAGAVPANVFDMPLLNQLTTSVAGGRVLSTTLVNVLLTTDGRVFVGSVPVAALQAAAAG